MGFNCGFNKIKKVDKDFEKCLYMMSYEYFKTNNFINNNNCNFNEYMTKMYSPLYKNFECKYSDEDLENTKYKNIKFEEIDYWYSTGRYIDDICKLVLTEIQPFEKYRVIEEDLDKMMDIVNEELDKNKLIPVTITHAFRYTEEGDKLMTLCDGILTQDEDQHEALIDLEFENIWIGSREFNIDKYYVLENFKNTLYNMRKVNLNKYYIYYYRSY